MLLCSHQIIHEIAPLLNSNETTHFTSDERETQGTRASESFYIIFNIYVYTNTNDNTDRLCVMSIPFSQQCLGNSEKDFPFLSLLHTGRELHVARGDF